MCFKWYAQGNLGVACKPCCLQSRGLRNKYKCSFDTNNFENEDF